MTIHASKGLEFDVVFIPGRLKGLIPYPKNDILDEQRLFYVAIPRAKDKLYLFHSITRRVTYQNGYVNTLNDCQPSLFINIFDYLTNYAIKRYNE